MSNEFSPTIGFLCVLSDPAWPGFYVIDWTEGHPGDFARSCAVTRSVETMTMDYFVLCIRPRHTSAELRRHVRHYGIDFSIDTSGSDIMYGVDLSDLVSLIQRIAEPLPGEFRPCVLEHACGVLANKVHLVVAGDVVPLQAGTGSGGSETGNRGRLPVVS